MRTFLKIAVIAAMAVFAASPYPSLPQTNVSVNDASRWITIHLPSEILGGFFATYSPHGCTIVISIKENGAGPSDENDYVWKNIYVVVGEPMPGKRFAIDLLTGGELNFKLLDLSSLRIESEYTNLFRSDVGDVGEFGFEFVYFTHDEANRMMRALRYLAMKCGAKAAPF